MSESGPKGEHRAENKLLLWETTGLFYFTEGVRGIIFLGLQSFKKVKRLCAREQ